jgi:outer membrane cobalamin receptor
MQIIDCPGKLLVLTLFAFNSLAAAVTVAGKVVDASEAAVSGAQVSAVNRLGVLQQARTGPEGDFEMKLPSLDGIKLMVTAAGFATATIEPAGGRRLLIRLDIAPQVDAIRVTGSALDVPLSEQGASTSVITSGELRERNESQAIQLMRYLPGVAVSQNAGVGGVSSIFIRGGDYDFNLVQIDGVTVNSFGGAFDFAHMPTDFLDRIEVVRGPQSAVYGPYANTGVVNFVTRSAEDSPNLDLLAEGGSHQDRRFAIGAAGTLSGWGIAAFASRLDNNGPVVNSDYRNENAALHVTRAFGHQFLSITGNFNSNETGEPGPYGSNPEGLFTGIDTVSRAKNNFSDYTARWQADLSSRVRQEIFGSFFLNNNYFRGDGFDSFNKDLRGQAEARTIVSVARWYEMAAGVTVAREEVRNSYISDNDFNPFLLRRNEQGLYWENRLQFGNRLFWNAGLRGDFFQTPAIPGNDAFGRPPFAAHNVARVDPKVAVAYAVRSGTRVHGSFGTGIRPPSGFDLAFTDNPALKPERTASFDAGLEQRLFGNRLSLDATYFYNRFYDLIVTLGGDLAKLSTYHSDNLANSRAQGTEFSANLRPARWALLTGSYTYLKSEILSLNGSSGLAPRYFAVGQELLRRPAHSGAFVSTFFWGRLTANFTGYLRGSVLDVEPNYGASAGLFRNPGFADIGLNVNYRIAPGVAVYGNLRNALNQHYEEAYGYPSPLINFVTGVKWSWKRKR